ncbi:MAG: metallophosphoesterase, partial [Pedobacter sp.]|nr:metallophosphoesterase [Chitinophagaceae bacterium]
MLLLDFYVYQAVKTVSLNGSDRSKLFIQIVYWTLSIVTLACLLSLPYIQALQTNKIFRNYVFAVLVGLFLAKLIGSVFFLIDDLRRGLVWIISKFSSSKDIAFTEEVTGISRSTFLSWVGLGVGGGLFGT